MHFLKRSRPASAKERAPPERWDLDTPLLRWSPVDDWSYREACSHLHALGGTGSGKTSALLATLVRVMGIAQFGFLCLCPKKETRKLFEQYARECGRSDRLVIISPQHPEHTFNFMQYFLTKNGSGGFAVENLVNMFSHIVELFNPKQTMGGDPFWLLAMRELLRAAVTILLLAKGTMTLDDVYRLLTDAPKTLGEVSNESWQANSFLAECIRQAEQKEMTPEQEHDFKVACTYWLYSFPTLSEKTRSSIAATLSGTLSPLMTGYAHTLFSSKTTVVPEACYRDGAWLVLDIPPEIYGHTGRALQCLFKYFWQLSMVQRDMEKFPRPVALLGDEYQLWVTSEDYNFLATARSSGVSVIALTQGISNYYSTLGAQHRDNVNALLGLFGTHVFLANADPVSNRWASELIGESLDINYNFSSSAHDNGMNQSGGGSQTIRYKVLPERYSRLRRGGPLNQWQVEGIVVKTGGLFKATGENYIQTTFLQR